MHFPKRFRAGACALLFAISAARGAEDTSASPIGVVSFMLPGEWVAMHGEKTLSSIVPVSPSTAPAPVEQRSERQVFVPSDQPKQGRIVIDFVDFGSDGIQAADLPTNLNAPLPAALIVKIASETHSSKLTNVERVVPQPVRVGDSAGVDYGFRFSQPNGLVIAERVVVARVGGRKLTFRSLCSEALVTRCSVALDSALRSARWMPP